MSLNLHYFFTRIVSVSILFLFCSVFLFSKYGAGTVTNRVRDDGFGAQFQTIIYTAIYADAKNLKFAYSPFQSMEHNYDDDPEFLTKKEQLINFKPNFPLAEQKIMVKSIRPAFAIEFFEKNINTISTFKSLQKIKQIFRVNKPQNFFNNDKFNIAIHIRRPNSHDNRLAGADVPDQKFLEIMALLQQKYMDKDYIIHIYSQGAKEDFTAFTNERVILHLNDTVEDSFTGMVLADALAISPSSFSYTAGLLSEGDVFYIDGFWHPPLEHWTIV